MVVGSVFCRGMFDLYSHWDIERAEKMSKCQGQVRAVTHPGRCLTERCLAEPKASNRLTGFESQPLAWCEKRNDDWLQATGRER